MKDIVTVFNCRTDSEMHSQISSTILHDCGLIMPTGWSQIGIDLQCILFTVTSRQTNDTDIKSDTYIGYFFSSTFTPVVVSR